MPTTTGILEMLTLAANEAMGVAILWHILLAAIAIALAAGWRPSIAAAMALPASMFASVAAVALATGNPFNAILYGVLALVVAFVFGIRGSRRPVTRGPAWMTVLGVALIAVGWIYPHFLERGFGWYLIAAPVGVVPCPTLYAVVGFTLLAGGFEHRGWMLTLAAIALVYAVTGVWLLRVYLDVGLFAGAAALAVAAFRRGMRPTERTTPAYSGGPSSR